MQLIKENMAQGGFSDCFEAPFYTLGR